MLRELGWATVAIGTLALGSGLLHNASVTYVAFDNRGGYDLRLGTLLALGVGVVLAGLLMVLGGLRYVHGGADAFLLSLLGSVTMLLMSAALTAVADGFWIGLVIYGGHLVALLVLGRP